MNKEVKEKWVAALRSGDYQQTRGLLSSGGRHCCLGVLCEIGVQEGILERDDLGYLSVQNYDDWNSQVLPRAAMEWAGLNGNVTLRAPGAVYKATYGIDHPRLDENGMFETSATELNDECGLTFSQIADLVEEQL